MPIQWDKWHSAYDPREARLRSMLGQPPSPDEIVTRVGDGFDVARILGGDGGGRPVGGSDALDQPSGYSG